MLINRTFRVFVSSTFEDLKEERNVLLAPSGPFDELSKTCHKFGARVQPVDLRWGVRDEAGHDQRTMEICLREIKRCQHSGLKPNFLILLGNRYGWRPLPNRIEAVEFQTIRAATSNNADRKLIDDWYNRLDVNAVPTEYLLKPLTGEFLERDRWKEVEAALHNALLEGARTAGLSAAALIKYKASATHQEILQGVGSTAEDRKHVFAFFCRPSTPNEEPALIELKKFIRVQLGKNVHEPRDLAELQRSVCDSLARVIRTQADEIRRVYSSRPGAQGA